VATRFQTPQSENSPEQYAIKTKESNFDDIQRNINRFRNIIRLICHIVIRMKGDCFGVLF